MITNYYIYETTRGPVGLEGLRVFNEETGVVIDNLLEAEIFEGLLEGKIYQLAYNLFQFYRERFHLDGVDGRGAIPLIRIEWNVNRGRSICTSHEFREEFENKDIASVIERMWMCRLSLNFTL